MLPNELAGALRWKLLEGSHKWPGPSGGTCINEAAVVVAGFPYRRVTKTTDLPPCFCPVLSEWLISINDSCSDTFRQRLIRYVTRLAGSADPSNRLARQRLLITETYRQLWMPRFEKEDVRIAAFARRTMCDLDRGITEHTAFEELTAQCRFFWQRAIPKNAQRIEDLFTAANTYRAGAAPRMPIYNTKLLNIVDAAFAIGNQAPPVEHALILQRVAAAKACKQPESV